MGALGLIAALAAIVEGLVEYFGQLVPSKYKPWAAAIVGVILCLLWRADIFTLAGYPPYVPYAGEVLTGILIGRGSNFINDIFTRLQFIRPGAIPLQALPSFEPGRGLTPPDLNTSGTLQAGGGGLNISASGARISSDPPRDLPTRETLAEYYGQLEEPAHGSVIGTGVAAHGPARSPAMYHAIRREGFSESKAAAIAMGAIRTDPHLQEGDPPWYRHLSPEEAQKQRERYHVLD